MMTPSSLVLWIGIGLVLLVLITRWRMGAWDIENPPPSPSILSLVVLAVGLIMVGAGAYLVLLEN